MLCDSLRSGLAKYGWFEQILNRVDAAPKFILEPAFALSVDQLSMDASDSLERLMPFCRTPFPEIWVEFVHKDRKLFSEVPLRGWERVPDRVGFLITQIGDTCAHWKAHLFWSFGDQMNCSAGAMEFHELDENFEIGSLDADWVQGAPWALRKMFQFSINGDWQGEGRFLFAILALMNARNCSEQESVSMIRLNKRRAASGKTPLFDYRLLKVHSRVRKRIGEVVESKGFKKLRAHFVRGHFKVRKTGIYYWSPFVRGELKYGFADKDYRLAS